MIAGGGGPATSDCIGAYDTVECLADSIAACTAGMEVPPYVPEYVEPALCSAIPGYTDGVPFYGAGPRRTQLHLYRIDVWELGVGEAWSLPNVTDVQAGPGDRVLDFYTITCSPNPGCLKTLDPLMLPGAILAACPQTFCITKDWDANIPDPADPGGEEIVYTNPAGTFLIRPQDGGWRIVDWYSSMLTCMKCPIWLPEHWRKH